MPTVRGSCDDAHFRHPAWQRVRIRTDHPANQPARRPGQKRTQMKQFETTRVFKNIRRQVRIGPILANKRVT